MRQAHGGDIHCARSDGTAPTISLKVGTGGTALDVEMTKAHNQNQRLTPVIEFLNFLHLRGPNQWTYHPVIEAWVDIGALEDSPSNTLPGFNARLTALLPTLAEHRCSYGEPGGFLKRLEEGTWPAHILEHLTLELQNLAGMPGGFGRARGTSRRGVYKVVVRCWHEDITRQALHFARDLLLAAIEDRPYDVQAAVAVLADQADRLLLGPSTRAIVDAAEDKSRRIPAIRLNEGNLVQLGYGANSRRVWTAETDATSAIAESISRDKALTNALLRNCGVPVPASAVVTKLAEAWPAAEDIGLPVTVKPVDANHGCGVSLNLTQREEIETAFQLAWDASRSGNVLIEQFIPGVEHRLLVVGGKLIAAARGEEAWVTGDGAATVRELIATQIDSDPRRGAGEDFPLSRILDENEPTVDLELARQGLSLDAVAEAGRRVLVRRNGNVAADCTDEVHPQTAAFATLAARIVGLDIAGIDLVAGDISRPLAAQGGALIEVNAGPGLLAHLKPASGKPRPVGEAIVDQLFPPGVDSRIPLVGVSGSHAATAAAAWLHRLLSFTGKTVGLATPESLRLGEQSLLLAAADGVRAQQLLTNRALEAAVIANPPRTIASEGLAYDRCLIGVVTDFDDQALLPEYCIDDADRLYAVLRTQVDVVLPKGVAVLNAASPALIEMAALCDGEVIFFARDEAVLPTRAEGSTLGVPTAKTRGEVFLRNDAVVLRRAGREETLMPVSQLPACNVKPIRSDIPVVGALTLDQHLDSLLAAIAAAWALELANDTLRNGMASAARLPFLT
jgi:cyanophycin synthetase